jgi:hypothetical protein
MYYCIVSVLLFSPNSFLILLSILIIKSFNLFTASWQWVAKPSTPQSCNWYPARHQMTAVLRLNVNRKKGCILHAPACMFRNGPACADTVGIPTRGNLSQVISTTSISPHPSSPRKENRQLITARFENNPPSSRWYHCLCSSRTYTNSCVVVHWSSIGMGNPRFQNKTNTVLFQPRY